MKLYLLNRIVLNTDWNMFRDAAIQENNIHLDEYTSTVSTYISKCVDDVVITDRIKAFPNQNV